MYNTKDARKKHTLHASLDNVERMNYQCRYSPCAETGDGLYRRGGETRMTRISHEKEKKKYERGTFIV